MYKRVFLICLAVLATHGVYAQQAIDSVVSRFRKQSSAKPSELIYIQTSKGIYETGEDLWFKAYQLDAQTFGLSGKSKTLYLQMINLKDSVVWQEKYLIENGIASGHVYVDEKLPEGDYFLEGYTKNSLYKSDTTGMLSSRKIGIVKSISRSEICILTSDSSLRLQMFAEGGNLVYGLLSKLACMATNGKGNPVNVEGTLYQDDEPINRFTSIHNGMATMLLTPIEGKKYRIELTNGNSYPLPEIRSNGMTLQLSKRTKDQLDFIVSQSRGQAEQQIYLIGQMRGVVCCVAKAVINENLKISIPLNNFLYQGVAEFTLFNQDMQPIAERLVYIHPEKKLHITLEPDKNGYATREKATIHIKVTDEQGKPVKTDLGMSVYDKAYTNHADPINILTLCYLSSQIRGKIYNPAYYFDPQNKDRSEALDLLLLTQGWRRYIWDATDSDYQGQPFLTDEINGIQIIESKKRNHQNQTSDQLIQISGAAGNSTFTWADSTGHFTVTQDLMSELRGGYIYLKPMLSKEFKPALQIDNFFPEISSQREHRAELYPDIDLSQLNRDMLSTPRVVSLDSMILLDQVTVIGKGRKPFRDKFMGRLDSLAQINLNSAWVCGCGSETGNGYLNDYLGYSHHPAGSPSPPIKKRSAPVDGKDYELIKYEPKGKNGIWIVTDIKVVTYRGAEFGEQELMRMNNLWRTKGYYAAREFYQPDEIDMQSSMPDARNTLLWAPSIATDEKGEATVSFYCSDINTGFIGLVEGVDGAGLLGSAKCEFRVIKK